MFQLVGNDRFCANIKFEIVIPKQRCTKARQEKTLIVKKM